MKILLSTPFDVSHPGGVNAHVANLDRELQRMGHTTRVLSPGACDGAIDDDGHVCKIGRAHTIPANGSLARLALSPFLSKHVRAFLDEEKFDIIHLNDPLTSTLHLTVLANSQTTNVGTFHASNSSYLGFNLLYRIGRPVFARFDQHLHYRIAVSPIASEFISHYFPGDYHLIPNGIDFDRFGANQPPHPDLRTGDPTVLFVGRFDEPRKGFRHLLESMARVQDQIPCARLLVAGPGNPDSFRRQISQRRIAGVQFIGEVPDEALPAIYTSCDVFCAPSTGRESFGIVLLEAMASGKPVVASNIAGYRSVIQHDQEGLLTEPCNPASLSSAILSVLRDPELANRLGVAGRERARHCAWPTVAQRVVECYEEASARGPSLATSESLVSGTRRP